MMSNEVILLEQEILSDIAERKDLMSRVKLLSPRYNFSEADEHLFLNYSIPIIYSIWEGFIQSALQTYIRSLNRLRLSPDDICDQILIYHMESEFLQFKQYPRPMNREDQLKRTNKQKVNFFKELKRFYRSETIAIDAKVNTESNVKFNVLNRILGDFNLSEISEFPLPRYSLKIELNRFVDIRNKVAHGQDSVIVSFEDLERAITVVGRLVELVFASIRDGFINESYKKC